MTERVLVVNADDFGLSAGVNRGVIAAHEHGIVTSASLMVRAAGATEAGEYARSNPALGVGLHFDLGEWEYRDDRWQARYEVEPLDDRVAIARELDRQLGTFVRLVGRLPSHLDSHQHVHRTEPVRAIVAGAGAELVVPVRDLTPGITYLGTFYGQYGKGVPFPEAISTDALVAIVESLPAGVTELGCHPGLGGDVDTMYGRERTQEVEALCAPQVRAVVETSSVALCSFADRDRFRV